VVAGEEAAADQGALERAAHGTHGFDSLASDDAARAGRVEEVHGCPHETAALPLLYGMTSRPLHQLSEDRVIP